MKNRLVLVINPRSSGYSLVHEKIVRNINRLNLAENQRMTYEIQPDKRVFSGKNLSECAGSHLRRSWLQLLDHWTAIWIDDARVGFNRILSVE